MKIPVDITLDGFFKVFVGVLNPILQLKPREQEVLTVILKVYYANKHLPAEDLNKSILSSNTRKVMRKSIKMSEASFNNHLVQLKKRGVISQDNQIAKFIISNLPKTKILEVTYTINIHANKQPIKNDSSK